MKINRKGNDKCLRQHQCDTTTSSTHALIKGKLTQLLPTIRPSETQSSTPAGCAPPVTMEQPASDEKENLRTKSNFDKKREC